MVLIETGTIFIGFTGACICARCQNNTPFQVRRDYVKQSLVGRVPLLNQVGDLYLICPVCEATQRICRGAMINRAFKAIFSENKWSDLHALLESGKEITKRWVDELRPKERAVALKRLNAVEAYHIVRYIEMT